MNTSTPKGRVSPPPRTAKVPLIIAAVLVVVAMIVGAVWVLAANQKNNNPATNEGPASAIGIAAGSGGTATASDKLTKIGYEPSCTGAVQAASNYATTVDLYKPPSDQAFITLTHEVFVSPQAAEPFLKESARMARVTAAKETQQEWGGAYKVAACEPGKSATIELYSCYIERELDPRYASTDCYPIRTSLRWTDNDWKLESLESVRGALTGVPKAFSAVFGNYGVRPPGVTAEQWTKLTAPDTQGPITGWADFTNAHR